MRTILIYFSISFLNIFAFSQIKFQGEIKNCTLDTCISCIDSIKIISPNLSQTVEVDEFGAFQFVFDDSDSLMVEYFNEKRELISENLTIYRNYFSDTIQKIDNKICTDRIIGIDILDIPDQADPPIWMKINTANPADADPSSKKEVKKSGGY